MNTIVPFRPTDADTFPPERAELPALEIVKTPGQVYWETAWGGGYATRDWEVLDQSLRDGVERGVAAAIRHALKHNATLQTAPQRL